MGSKLMFRCYYKWYFYQYDVFLYITESDVTLSLVKNPYRLFDDLSSFLYFLSK